VKLQVRHGILGYIASFIALLLLVGVTGLTAQTLNYKVKYGLIQAGSAKLVQTIDSSRLHSQLSINSSPWLSNMWVLADSITSTYDLAGEQLLEHLKIINEGSYRRRYDAVFLDSGQVRVNGKSRSFKQTEIWDLPSLLYKLSTELFSPGDTLHYRFWDGRSAGDLRLVVAKILTPNLLHPFAQGGWRLYPISSSRKSRENKIQLELLLSESAPHIPLRIQIDTKFGNVIIYLVTP